MDENIYIDEDEILNVNYNVATKKQRAVNYFIDTAIIYGLFYFFNPMSVFTDNLYAFMDINQFSTIQQSADVILLLILYYFFLELNNGKTPGKYFTKTKVLNTQGKSPSVGAIFIRTISRLIPLENIFFLIGYPLHDQFSKTVVISESDF